MLIEVGARTSNGFVRNVMIKEEELQGFVDKYNNTDVFRTVYNYESVDRDTSTLMGDLYFDLDNNALKDKATENVAFESVKEDAKKILAILEAIFYVPKDQIEIYFSGGKGLHIIVPKATLGIQPRKDLNNIFKEIVMDIKRYLANDTVDVQIYDNKRLFRVPNSKHSSTDLYKIALSHHELMSLTFQDIKVLASQQREFEHQAPAYNTRAHMMYRKYIEIWENKLRLTEERRKKKNNGGAHKYHYLPPCISGLLLNGVSEGNRNNTVAVLASYYKQNGHSEDETIGLLDKYNEELIIPALPYHEVERTVASVFVGEYGYGCRTLTDMGLCEDGCKILTNRERNSNGN